jgi:hypothetical protein
VTGKEKDGFSRLSLVRERIGDISKEDIGLLTRSTPDRGVYGLDGYSEEYDKSMERLKALGREKKGQVIIII